MLEDIPEAVKVIQEGPTGFFRREISPNEKFESEYAFFETIHLNNPPSKMDQDAYPEYMKLEEIYAKCAPSALGDFKMGALRQQMQRYAEDHRI